MATLAVGSVASRIMGIAAMPVLTRLYDPDDFGILAAFDSLISIMMTAMTLRYALAIPLPRRDSTAANLFALSFGLMVGKCIVVGLAMWVFGPSLLRFLSLEILYPYWWLIIIGLLGASSYEILSLWATRRRSYNIVARTTAAQGFMGNAAKLILGAMSVQPLGLLIGQVISTSAGITSLWLYFRNDFWNNKKRLSFSRIKIVTVRYWHFPVYRLPSQFLLVLAQQMPTMFIAATFGSKALGQYALAKMLVSLPIQLLSGTLSNSAYGELAKIGKTDPERTKNILNSVIRIMFFASLFPAILIFIVSPIIFPWIFGAEWATAGYFASGLSIYLIAAMIAVPMPAFVNVFEKQKELLIWNLARCVIIALLFVMVIKMKIAPVSFVFLYGVTMLIFQACVVLRTNWIVDNERKFFNMVGSREK